MEAPDILDDPDVVLGVVAASYALFLDLRRVYVPLGLEVVDEALGQARDLAEDVFELQTSGVPGVIVPNL